MGHGYESTCTQVLPLTISHDTVLAGKLRLYWEGRSRRRAGLLVINLQLSPG